MKPFRPGPLDPTRIRRIEGSFGWIPHAFIRRRITRTLSGPELLLYFFLCVVADAGGVSFYGDALLTEHLSFDPHALDRAKRGLVHKGLILYREGVYQVLPLPLPAPEGARPAQTRAMDRDGPVSPLAKPEAFRQIVRRFLEKIDA